MSMNAIAASEGIKNYFNYQNVDAIRELVEEILINGAYTATKYFNDELTVKATLKKCKGKIAGIVITIGPPNYEERRKIKKAEKAGQGSIEMTMKYPAKVEKK